MNIIPRVEKGKIIPYGLSTSIDIYNDSRKYLYLKVPVFPCIKTTYCADRDEELHGWKLYVLLFKFELHSGFQEIGKQNKIHKVIS